MTNNNETPNKLARNDETDIKRWLQQLGDLMVVGLPTLLINRFFEWLIEPELKQPWQSLWVVGPIAFLVIMGLYWLYRFPKHRPRWGLQLVFIGYVSAFIIAANSQLLDWKREPVGFENQLPANLIGLNWLGDWRYGIAPRVSASDPQLLVLLLPSPANTSLIEKRHRLAKLIKVAVDKDVEGIVLDAYFEKESRVDPVLCSVIKEAAAQDIKVFAGYGVIEYKKKFSRRGIPESLKSCLNDEQLGHLIGLKDADNVVRHVPLYLSGNQKLESLSLKVARAINETIEVPKSGLLAYLQARPLNESMRYEELEQDPRARAFLRDKWLLIGFDSKAEHFQTPDGERLGVQIHAAAIHSLVNGTYIRYAPGWSLTLTYIAACYLLVILASRAVGPRGLVLCAAAISVASALFSALSIRFALIWLDLAHLLLAIWILVGVLSALPWLGGVLRRPTNDVQD